MTEPVPVSLEQIVGEVMGDTDMLQTLNDNPAKVVLSPDGTEAELSIAEVLPAVVVATINALDRLGVIDFHPEEELGDSDSVG